MKKKGLIISTVVMVVVLIASLTTATYAWFTASTAVQVNPITLNVKSNAVVNVGVKTTTGLTDGTSNEYLYSELTLDETKSGNEYAWKNGVTGLGQILNFGELKIEPEQAIGTAKGAQATGWTVDNDTTQYAKFLSTSTTAEEKRTFIKAPASITDGKSNDVLADNAKATEAIANKEYLDATIGVAANGAGIKGMYVKVQVTTTDTLPTLGMNAAIHFVFQDHKGDTYDVQPFGSEKDTTTKVTYATNKITNSNVTTGLGTSANDTTHHYGLVTKADDGKNIVSTFYFWVATSDNAFAVDGTVVKNFRVLMYIDGADTDCNSNALGSIATVAISFDGTTDFTKLSQAEKSAEISTVKFINTAESVK